MLEACPELGNRISCMFSKIEICTLLERKPNERAKISTEISTSIVSRSGGNNEKSVLWNGSSSMVLISSDGFCLRRVVDLTNSSSTLKVLSFLVLKPDLQMFSTTSNKRLELESDLGRKGCSLMWF
ncbi:hypothetical protein OGATHE_004528 [Ogataea polymorpha]|uniref:Uncharacterized protein n=1 Tax=Ogataea polymorpha TaxID=460523 RepID=A0A9P8P158_9ASCO|nr:hypothetical protein OGATHE_004528 [Ogataea polymorpha]